MHFRHAIGAPRSQRLFLDRVFKPPTDLP